MIIIGYPGIGKSSSISENNKFIDLESGNFWVNDENTSTKVRDSKWYIVYCNIAEHLSQQGYIVFVSSHKEVRDRLKKSKELVAACYPDISLKDQWIKRLKDRYDKSKLEKDYKALMNAKDKYEENIKEIENDCHHKIRIESMDYSLAALITRFMYFYKRGETV